mmetsp:Transcript_46896/g.109580  ORF Transcript_46896/g.109580 Transcript_46896/m.109580 type:complete len:95 (+) Transcript_46896:572-856(+)
MDPDPHVYALRLTSILKTSALHCREAVLDFGRRWNHPSQTAPIRPEPPAGVARNVQLQMLQLALRKSPEKRTRLHDNRGPNLSVSRTTPRSFDS